MTRLEFAKAMKQQRRGNGWIAGLMTTGMIVGIFAIIIFAAAMDTRPSNTQVFAVVFGALLFLLFWVALGIFVGRRRMRKAGMFCTKCDTLLHTTAISIAIATGNCSICGQKFLED